MKKYLVSLLVIISILSGLTYIEAEAAEESGNNMPAHEVIYLPEELLANNSGNPSRALENFLNNSSNKKVVFPKGKTIILERQLVIHHVENLEIDFNGCTIKLPENCSWKPRYDTGEYVPVAAITIYDSSNITLRNYTIDGNSSNISASQWCIGLFLTNVYSFSSYNGSFKYCNYHHIVIGLGTKNIVFNGTYFKDHGGATKPAGISDVYVYNDPDDNFSFFDTTVDNTALKDRQAQCFYIDGYNGLIDTVYANNCSIPLDIRKGTHIARNFTVRNAEQVLMVQPSSSDTDEFASLTALNFTGTNIIGNKVSAAGVYILACEKVHLDNFRIQMDPASEYSWYGIRIRKFFDNNILKDVIITDTEVSNAAVSGYMIQNLADSVLLKDISSANAPYAVKTLSCTAKQYVENLKTINSKKFDPKDNMIAMK